MTSLQTRFKPLAKLLATRCAFCDPQRERTRTAYADLLRGRFFLDRSCKSNLRSSRRSQAQNFSTGFKSGERGGMCHNDTPCSATASFVAFAFLKKLSLSHNVNQGPSGFIGFSLRMASVNFPLRTTSTNSWRKNADRVGAKRVRKFDR
jgi:hypothetical protein